VVQHEVRIKEEEEDDDDAGTVVHRTPEESLVDELLSEEEL
jgi:condensin complex subunit 3